MELGCIVDNHVMDQEVTELAGEHSRDKPHRERYSRFGTEPGSMHVDRQRLPIKRH